MLKQHILLLMSSLMLLQLAGCHSTQSSSRVLVYLIRLHKFRKKFIDRHAPKGVTVTNNIRYIYKILLCI